MKAGAWKAGARVPEHARYVILGSGPAGTRAAETIRRRDPDGRIVVVSDDPHPFYNRILLSKNFLKDDRVPPEGVILKPAEAYARQAIELRAGVRAVGLDPAAREVVLAPGGLLTYERCLIATGARPLALPVPGADLPGVHTLRTLEDAIALRSAAAGARRAVIVGGGLIGLEVAAALAGRGVGCTLVAREAWLYGHIAPEPVGRALEAILRAGGVHVRLDATVAAIERADGIGLVSETGGTRSETGRTGFGLRVRTIDGKALDADLVPTGVGVVPDVDFLAGTGLACAGRGVQVDAYLRSAVPDVYAAGDVADYFDPLVGARHRVEHWLHAQHQGRRAGENMTGGDAPYARVSSYDTELFGVPVAVTGCPELARSWVERGALAEAEGTAYGLREKRIVAAFRIGAAADRGEAARLIEAGAPIAEAG